MLTKKGDGNGIERPGQYLNTRISQRHEGGLFRLGPVSNYQAEHPSNYIAMH